MAYPGFGYNLRQPMPFGVPAVSPWPANFQATPPVVDMGNIDPRRVLHAEDIRPAGQQQEPPPAPGGVPPMFPRLAERFPRMAQAGQRIRQAGQNFDERFPKVGEFRANNRDMLTNVGMALLTTRPGEGAPVREAFYYGRQSDQERRAKAEEQARQDAERQQFMGLIGGGAPPPTPAGGQGQPPAQFQGDWAPFLAERAPGARVEGMDPAFAGSLAQAAADFERETGQRATFASLARTTEEQAELYASYQRGEIGLAAPPGQSRHERGAAADIPSGPFLEWMHQNAGRYGLGFLSGDAFSRDPGHVQLAGNAPAGGGPGPAPRQGGPQQGGGLNPEQQAFLGALYQQSPEAAMTLAGQWMFAGQREPIKMGDDTLLDPITFRPIWQDTPDNYRPLTDPAERQMRGIPADDTRPYQVGPDNQVHLVGGGGVNVYTGADGDPVPPGFRPVDTAFGTEYQQWVTGGFADVQRQIEQLDLALADLRADPNLTGPLVGQVPDWALVWANPEAVDIRDRVADIVQRNLRLILGAQFTQREGELLIQRAFNPSLPAEQNVRRITALVEAMRAAADAKQQAADYFGQHGTLWGYTGRLPTLDPFEDIIDGRATGGEWQDVAPGVRIREITP